MRQTTIFDDDVSQKIQSLLERCNKIRRASDLPTGFDERGERHARRIAAADGVAGQAGSPAEPGRAGGGANYLPTFLRTRLKKRGE